VSACAEQKRGETAASLESKQKKNKASLNSKPTVPLCEAVGFELAFSLEQRPSRSQQC
jgi:hypothetical protein